MTSKPASIRHQAPYARRGDQTRLHGMRRSSSSMRSQEPTLNLREDLSINQLSRSLSDIWALESKQSAAEDNLNKPGNLERGSMPNPIHEKDEGIKDDSNEEVKNRKRMGRADGGMKSYFGLSEISLPPSAASYYSGNGQGARLRDTNAETCRSIHMLNLYLKDRKMELDAGVPGKFLHAVIGQDAGDVGSVVSTITYAFYLNENRKSNNLCTLPVVNMKREDLSMHCELKWLLTSCHVDLSSLVFIDEIDLSYYDIFGSLKLVLLNGQNLPSKQEGLRGAVVEIFNCPQDESECSWVETMQATEGCSCCALIAEKFAEASPETLGGHGFNRLLLAGILWDTANLSNEQCTSKDKYLATLLLKGAGRFGRNGLYQILKYKMFDISDLKVKEILRRDFKKWTRVAGKPDRSGSRLTVSIIGMSTIGISVEQLLAHEGSAAQEITFFLKSEKLRLLLIVSGYYDSRKNFKREILVCADTVELMQNFLYFFNANGTNLPLKPLQVDDVGEELRAFEINDNMTSRRTMERLLEDFGGTLRQQTWGMLSDVQCTDQM